MCCSKGCTIDGSSSALSDSGLKYAMLVALGLFAGANLTFQALVNAQLRGVLQSPLRAGLVSYLGGTLFCAVFLAVRRESFALFDGHAGGSNVLLWTGGLYGLIYLLLAIWLIPRMGSGQVFVIIVAGQLLAALVFDQLGLFGVTPRPIDAYKIIGVVLLIAAVFLIRR